MVFVFWYCFFYEYIFGVIFNSLLFWVLEIDFCVVLNIDNILSGVLGFNYDIGVI